MKKKDLISRQDVINAISKLPVKVDDQGYTWMIASDVLNQIDDIPSAEPERKNGECTKNNCPFQRNYISNDCDIKTCPYRTEQNQKEVKTEYVAVELDGLKSKTVG